MNVSAGQVMSHEVEYLTRIKLYTEYVQCVWDDALSHVAPILHNTTSVKHNIE